MLYTPLTMQAMRVCFEAHKLQTDKGGVPYVFHPYHLAEQMSTEAEICAALLHDVVEDGAYTLQELSDMGFPAEITDAVALLTHDNATPYLEYVFSLKADPVACRVKLADLKHNCDLSRIPDSSAHMREKRDLYLKAIQILEA